jgi:hypothetical protein
MLLWEAGGDILCRLAATSSEEGKKRRGRDMRKTNLMGPNR